MDISRDELLEALEHGLEIGLTEANLLTGYVFGWRAGKELLSTRAVSTAVEAPAQPQVGDLVRSRLGAVGGEDDEPGLHDVCHVHTGLLVESYSKGLYNNGYHFGPLSDFEKVEDN